MNCLFCHNPLMQGLNKIFQNITIFRQLAEYISGIILKGTNQNLIKYLYCIGSLGLTVALVEKINQTFSTWQWYLQHSKNMKNLNKQNLLKKYGKCWVAITGFTGGIGLSYVNFFAKLNYNLLLIDCNTQNVKKKVKLINQIYPEIQIKYLVADFSEEKQIDKLIVQIKKQAQNIDIGIFINNSGLTAGGDFLQIDPKGLLKCSQINLIAPLKICKQIVPILLKRQKRSALINMSSCTGYFISSHVGVYSMTKKMFDIYTRNLEKQNGNKIDIISVRPFGVITPMMKMKKGAFMITPNDCVRSTIADCLAGKKYTFTGAEHKMFHGFLQWKTQNQILQMFAQAWLKNRQK